jgi:hypothetical protein
VKLKKKYIGIIIFGTVTIPLIIVIFWEAGYPILFGVGGALRANKMREKLLRETDHQLLLKAGREILSQVSPIENKTEGGHKIYGNFLPVPKEVQIPKAIQNIHPHAILINSNDYLMIEMHGGMDHFGVLIYPKDFKVPFPGFRYGDRKLIDGLWYYDDD